MAHPKRFLLFALQIMLARVQATPPFSGCDVATYYASLGVNFPPSTVTPSLKADLHDLISPHNVIEYGYEAQDVDAADALKVTDEDPNNPGLLFDIYRDATVAPTQYIGKPDEDGTNFAWSKEHLWPVSR